MANLYEQLGDKENAEKTIELGTKTACRGIQAGVGCG